MFPTNGNHVSVDLTRRTITPPKEDVLDRMAEILRRGRRDRNAVRRIVHEYGIPNDAGIADTIVSRTVDSVERAAEPYDTTDPYRNA